MDELFEQLKSAAPINKYINSAPPSPTFKRKKSSDFSNEFPSDGGNTSPRRESMPPPNSAIVFKKPANKSRSMSPPKQCIVTAGQTKPFKVLIERKKLEDLISGKRLNNLQKPTVKRQHLKQQHKSSNVLKAKKAEKPGRPLSKDNTALDVRKKTTPTKAQQKLFDPSVLKQAQILKEFKVKSCMVRLQRKNLKKLQKELAKLKAQRKEIQKLAKKKESSLSPKSGQKRKSIETMAEPTSPKRGRIQVTNAKDTKQKAGFFIKISSPTSGATKKKNKAIGEKKSHTVAAAAAPPPTATPLASVTTLKKSATQLRTKPTKFTRTQLIKTFGKRFFSSHVKIERCTHPLMLIFESNARARKAQSKRNKSKNLSVSFKDQVEIFGDSDSESELDESDDLNFSASTSQAALNKSLNVSTSLPVMPTRLKKVENGKVIDDIEFDPSMFIDPQTAKSSTPFISPGRKKREKKSYSPLKGDGTPSPRKEQLKLANEKLPPCGLRRLNIDIDDDDDEDDDCEYIVPIEIPQRRTSRTSSTNTIENVPTTDEATEIATATTTTTVTTPDTIPTTTETAAETHNSLPLDEEKEMVEAIKTEAEPTDNQIATATEEKAADSTGSFESAVEQISLDAVQQLNNINSVDENLPQHNRDEVSPAPSLTATLRDLVDSVLNSSDNVVKENNEKVANGNDITDAVDSDKQKEQTTVGEGEKTEKVEDIEDVAATPSAALTSDTFKLTVTDDDETSKLLHTLDSNDDDISLQLYVEADSQNETDSAFINDDAVKSTNNIVDSIELQL